MAQCWPWPKTGEWSCWSSQIDLPCLPFVFDIAVGVRRDDRALRDSLDAVLVRRRADVARLLEAYGVPRVDVTTPRPAARAGA